MIPSSSLHFEKNCKSDGESFDSHFQMTPHLVYIFFSECKPDAGYPVHTKFVFSDVDSLSTATQLSN